MEYFFQQLINGITLGSVYALIALGYTMVYGIIQLINFAHGEFFAAGGYVGVIFMSYLLAQGAPAWVCLSGSLILAMAYCAMLAMAVEKVAYKPLRSSSRLSVLLSALGMSIFLQNGLMLTQGVYDRPYPTELTQGGFEFGTVMLSYMQLFIVSLTAFLLVALNFLVFKTRIGKAMRSTAQDKIMSALVGINSNRIISLTFAIGAGLAAAAGIMVGLYYGSVRYDMGFVPGIKAFAAAVLGGIGNITGAMIGGFIIGMVEIFAAGYISGEYKDVFAFLILIGVLYFRPSGIMGENVDDTRV
ncbi:MULTISPECIES: branched-chain amino acid ABC transporter permease [Desulfovibrionaceae]|uniref:Inner-membrane translocator n=1 Tax=Maridesulfovibrio salexigens (strain ATCC 14822 / DSM 2638 / NCIMB 8403 / VKM B-1763) TaxID=526222 RepID=C6BVU0_MARSD|nr:MULTISPECIES: branched-chain amino acid ABC transporter permease [Desulfovibrionaceae]ACS78304.1 inner-membrane translocator [Maridesulfovibrio salexigens DSM 2638]NDV23856.1 branched-chain amino acid ABC transporter permease [Desulfovibrio sp. JC022]TIH12247.1 branched-chain amino acid ABC transporter permease [Marinifilum sp. JC120]